MISRCKSCNAEIVWIKTPAGKMARPVQVRKSHFASCPQADQHRNARE